jgi:uncharacterized protein
MGRREVMWLAVLFEGGLGVLACLIGWAAGLPPWEKLTWDLADAALGVAACLPMLTGFTFCVLVPLPPLARIREFMDRVVRPLFRDCTLADLALISLLAGLGEELFFRGLLQEALTGWLGPWPALTAVALLFGLLHPITPAYFVLASLAGAYLGAAYLATDNLLVPVIAHALYDFVALVYLLRVPQGERAEEAPPLVEGEAPPRHPDLTA